MLVKILGGIDLVASFTFLSLAFGISLPYQILIFSAGLLALKGAFIFTGEIVLSSLDLISAMILIISIFFNPWAFLLWAPAFLLISKGILSFI